MYMRAFIAFIYKEILEFLRTGKLLLIAILFVLFGVMNPAIAKLTPLLFDELADSMKEQGIIFTGIEVNAFTSWEQFYKNVPIVFIVFVLIFSGICTTEYQKQTLLNMLTKGLKRRTVFLAKLTVAGVIWSGGYWMSYLITYFYNDYFWHNEGVNYPLFAGMMIYVFGLLLVSLIMFFSAWQKTNTGVMMGVGASCIVFYAVGLFSDIKKYVPVNLISGMNVLKGVSAPVDYLPSIIVSLGFAIMISLIAIYIFDRREVIF